MYGSQSGATTRSGRTQDPSQNTTQTVWGRPPMKHKAVDTTSTNNDRADGDALVDVIERRSPEGRPADGGSAPRTVAVAIAIRFGLIVIAAILTAVLIGPPIALAVLGVGAVLVAVDPSLWSAIERAREIAEIGRDERVVTDDETGGMS